MFTTKLVRYIISTYKILKLIMIVLTTFQVYNFVKLTELYYAGSHGMDIKGPEQGSKYEQVRFVFLYFLRKKIFENYT